MKIQRQLTVFLENQPGMMNRICSIMKKNKINILAFTLFGTVDHGVLRMIVDKPIEALHSLGEKGVLVIDTEVLEIDAVNEPGTLAKVTSLLSRAKVNVEYGYGSTGIQGGRERFYLQVSNNRKALLVMKNRNLKKKAREKGRAAKSAARPRAAGKAKKTSEKTVKKTSARKTSARKKA